MIEETKKSEFIKFLKSLESLDGLKTTERVLGGSQEIQCEHYGSKKRFIENITKNFDDDLRGDYNKNAKLHKVVIIDWEFIKNE